MEKPNPKNFYPKDFINGKYEKALEDYISYLENKIENKNQLIDILTKNGQNLLKENNELIIALNQAQNDLDDCIYSNN